VVMKKLPRGVQHKKQSDGRTASSAKTRSFSPDTAERSRSTLSTRTSSGSLASIVRCGLRWRGSKKKKNPPGGSLMSRVTKGGDSGHSERRVAEDSADGPRLHRRFRISVLHQSDLLG